MSRSIPTSPPEENEYQSFYAGYVAKVPSGEILDVLETQVEELRIVISPLTDEQANEVHPPSSWTIKQVMGHLIDGEILKRRANDCLSRN